MHRRKTLVSLLALPLAAGLAVAAPGAAAQQGPSLPALAGKAVDYTVLADEPGSLGAVRAAVRQAGGTVLRGNEAIGLVTAKAPEAGFTERLARADGVLVAARVRPIGHAPKGTPRLDRDAVEKEHQRATGTRRPGKLDADPKSPGMDPLDDKLWGLRSVRADLARDKQPGSKRVKVGILDTGVDGSHPDIAPNFNRALSRNFAPDIPYDENGKEVDGPCEYRGCVDPPDVDGEGHGSHTAGTIAAAADGFGLSGVAPEVSLVNIRGAQDSGYFFLHPVVDAITYSGDVGLDVVNMSFYVDPWLYNCQHNPADSPQQQAQQRATTIAMNRALNYAHGKGVTQVASLGNQHSDLGAPQNDKDSPNFPAGSAHEREIDNGSCLSFPIEGPHTIGVGSFGPSQAKADYSNYGLEQISVSAPGGYFRDYFGTPKFSQFENMILSTYPRYIGESLGHIDENGNVTPKGVEDGVLKHCQGERCAYYQYLQGTSMSSPHAAGVAALIVSEHGRVGPDAVQRIMESTAREVPCPTPRTVDYLDEGRDASYTATCHGDAAFNGFYGHGAVDALSAVSRTG